MDQNQVVLYQKQDRVGTITLNRPERRNALNTEMLRGIVVALDDAERDPAINAIVLTGAGKGFCSGADVSALTKQNPSDAENSEHPEIDMHIFQQVPLRIRKCPKPVIGAINGAATGAGCDIALACDIRIAAKSAALGETYVRVGLAPGDGGCYFVPRLTNTAKACELIFTGEIIEASEALRIGLVNRVVPDEDFVMETFRLAHKIANGPAKAIQIAKQAIYRSLEMNLDAALQYIAPQQEKLRQSKDHQEGVAAFLEKRQPHFTGE